MIRAQNPLTPYWFTPEDQSDGEEATRFKIQGLNGIQFADLAPDLAQDAEGNIININGKGVRLCCRYGLVDWEHFDNDNGPVKFGKNMTANMACIPYDVLMELAVEIITASQVTEQEKKTSPSP